MAEDWKIVDQQEQDVLQAGGRLERVMRISFETRTGVQGTVDVPLDSYVPEYVQALIAEKVERIIAVGEL